MDALETEISHLIRDWAPEMERLLVALAERNSHTANHDGVNEVARLLERQILPSGLRTGAFVTGRSGQHLIARSAATDGNKALLLGHLDTVFPSDRPTAVRIEGDRILGPGVTDMKGGLTVLVTAVRALHEVGALDGRALTILLTADEETGSPTGRSLVEQEAADHHLGLVFETGSVHPSGGSTFVTSRKGFGRLTFEITGRESHGGSAKTRGTSAAVEMARQILALEGLNDPDAGDSVNVGLARAGTAANTVPGSAVLEIDYRFASPQHGRALEAAIRSIAATGAQPNPLTGDVCSTRVVDGPRADPLLRTDAVGRMAERIKTWGRDLGLELHEESRGGGSDGNILSECGCPVVDGLGTVGGDIHSDGEWMLRSSLVERAQLAALILLRFWKL